jgi:hypothetical protein
MRNIRIWAIIATFAVTITAVMFVVRVSDGENISFAERLGLLERCVTDAWEPGSTLAGAVVHEVGVGETEKRLECAEKTLRGFKKLSEVQASNELLFRLNDTVPAARLACHDLAHEFGRWAYRDLGDEALITGQGDCGYGYYHGFMQRSMETEEPMKRIDVLRQFCLDEALRSADGEVLSIATYMFCSHGVGHSVAGVVETKEQGAELCSKLLLDKPGEYEFIWLDAEISRSYWPDTECYSGLLNQLWMGNVESGEGYSSVGETMEECSTVATYYRERCASYGLHYSPIPVIDMIRDCQTVLDASLRNGCWAGVGYRGSDIVFDPGRDPDPYPLLDGLQSQQMTSDPGAAAAFLTRLCDKEVGGGMEDGVYCIERFILESTQRTQEPDAMMLLCQEVENTMRSLRCQWAVDAVAEQHGGLTIKPQAPAFRGNGKNVTTDD